MLATQIEVSDGTLSIVNVGITFFNQADISVSLDQSDPLVTGVDYHWTSATTLQFLDTVTIPGGLIPNGVEVIIRRDTKNDEMYNILDGGAPFSRLTLDENYKQLLFLSQEFSEGLGLDGLRNNLNMNGYRLINVGDPISPQDAVNKQYMDDAFGRTLRVPEAIALLPAAIARANKVLAFDSVGNPVMTVPASGSVGEFAIDLADASDPAKGAAMVGYNGGTVRSALATVLNAGTINTLPIYKLGASPSILRDLHDKLSETVSVKDFGAVCDGVTDDSTAVQAAVDFCVSFNPPATLTVPGLTYLASPVRIERIVDGTETQTFFTIKGDGISAGFMCDGTVMFTAYPGSVLWVPESHKVRFCDLAFRQSHWAYDGYIMEGRRFMAVDFTNCSFHKIRVASSAVYLQSWYFSHCSAYNYHGILLESTGGAYDVRWNMCKIQAATDNGDGVKGTFLSLTNGFAVHDASPVSGCSVTNCHIQAMSGDGIISDRIEGLTISSSYFEGNGGIDINFATARNIANFSANKSVVLSGNYFSSTALNLANPAYACVEWGRTGYGASTGNTHTNPAGNLHNFAAGGTSHVTQIMDCPGYQGIYTADLVYAAQGYVQPGSGGERLKTIRGNVSSAGGKTAGNGFTVTRDSAGTYTIIFSTFFSGIPSFTASAADTSGDATTVKYVTLAANYVQVRVRQGGSAVDNAFSFTVTGPA